MRAIQELNDTGREIFSGVIAGTDLGDQYLRHWDAEMDAHLLSVTTYLDNVLRPYRLCIRVKLETGGYLFYLTVASDGTVWSPPPGMLPPIDVSRERPVWCRQIALSSATALALYQLLTTSVAGSAPLRHLIKTKFVEDNVGVKLVFGLNGTRRVPYATTFT